MKKHKMKFVFQQNESPYIYWKLAKGHKIQNLIWILNILQQKILMISFYFMLSLRTKFRLISNILFIKIQKSIDWNVSTFEFRQHCDKFGRCQFVQLNMFRCVAIVILSSKEKSEPNMNSLIVENVNVGTTRQ